MDRVGLENLEINEKFKSCNYRLPNGTTCQAKFDSPIDLIKHLRSNHGFPEMHNPLIAAVAELKGPNFKSWRDEERVFLKMAPYKKDRFCILHIVEFKYWVRAWVTEADPSADPNQFIPVKITMPSPGFNKNVQDERLHQFTGKILPFGTYSFKKDDPVEYFDVPKNFALQYCKKRADGRFGLKVLFAFGEFDAKEIFKENGGELVIFQINEEDSSSSSEESEEEDDTETVATQSSGFGDEDDEEEIVRPFCEIYI